MKRRSPCKSIARGTFEKKLLNFPKKVLKASTSHGTISLLRNELDRRVLIMLQACSRLLG